MQEELISFEVAKLAKEKGFNEKSQHYYVLDFGSFQRNTTPFKFNTPLENENIYQSCKLSGSQPHLSLAPTQSLLQKWLREVHNIDFIISPKNKDLGKFYGCVIISNKFDNKNIGSNFTTYEEALERGLKEALIFIK